MNKIIYTLIAFCLCNIALGQIKEKTEIDTTTTFRNNLLNSGKVSFGLKAGYTHGNLFGSEMDYIFADSKTYWLSGFHAGILVNTQLSNYFWLKHELLFSQRGAGVTLFDSINGNYSSKLKTYYIDLYPINLTFHYQGFQIYGGPYISGLTHATIQRKDDNGNLYNDKSIFGDAGNSEAEDENKYLQKFDFGLNVGVEYRFSFGLFVGARYNHGFTDIFQYANSYTNGDNKNDNIRIYNRSLLFSVGYNFVGKRRKIK